MPHYLTVIKYVAVLFSLVAVIIAMPDDTAVIFPIASTVATFGLLLEYTIFKLLISICWPLPSVAVMTKGSVSPTPKGATRLIYFNLLKITS